MRTRLIRLFYRAASTTSTTPGGSSALTFNGLPVTFNGLPITFG